MAVSSARLFMNGEYYYRQIGDLAVNLCVARTISDAGWKEYLEGTLDIARTLGQGPCASLVAFLHAHPNAGQRRQTTAFLAAHHVRPIERLAVLTDSEILRGAMTAFGWLMPRSKLRAFRASGVGDACHWLHEASDFDEATAVATWSDARSQLRVC